MKNIKCLLLILLPLLVTTACRPALKEFQPESDSLFKITFSYPADWIWQEEIPYDEVKPSQNLPDSERFIVGNNGHGLISIQVYKSANPQAKMQEWMDGYLEAVTQTLRDDPALQIYYLEDVTTLLRSDTTIQIDGYNARWLTVYYPLVAIREHTSQPHLQEVIYLLTEDRFYIIDLSVREPEIKGRFHKEFNEMIKTIKIFP